MGSSITALGHLTRIGSNRNRLSIVPRRLSPGTRHGAYGIRVASRGVHGRGVNGTFGRDATMPLKEMI